MEENVAQSDDSENDNINGAATGWSTLTVSSLMALWFLVASVFLLCRKNHSSAV